MADANEQILLQLVNGAMLVTIALIVVYHWIAAKPSDARESDAIKAYAAHRTEPG
jgi:predicted phage tail protein